MLTDRKKLKIRKRKIRLIVFYFVIFAVVVGALGLFIYKQIYPEVKYISPLASNYSQDSSIQDEKNKQFIYDQLKNKKIEYKSLETQEFLYIIRLKDDSEVIISSKKDLGVQMSSLQFILSRLTMEGRKIKRLDLQFDRPIIVFEN